MRITIPLGKGLSVSHNVNVKSSVQPMVHYQQIYPIEKVEVLVVGFLQEWGVQSAYLL